MKEYLSIIPHSSYQQQAIAGLHSSVHKTCSINHDEIPSSLSRHLDISKLEMTPEASWCTQQRCKLLWMHEMELTWQLMDKEVSLSCRTSTIPRCTDLSIRRITRPHLETWELFVIQLHFSTVREKILTYVTDLQFPLYLQASFSKTKPIQPSWPLFDLPS